MAELGIAGAGFSGAVIARRLAAAGHRVTLFDSRDHVAGNCHTTRDRETGVLVHVYGPHIFHTARRDVWDWINHFETLRPYVHRVKATAGGVVYSLPVNLHTINQFYGTTMNPRQAAAFIAARVEHGAPPVTFEQQGLAFVGRELYDTFFAGYTSKQWGIDPAELPASVLQRLPLRFSYDDTYFAHPFQGIPANGYTSIVERIVDHARIDVRLCEQLDAHDTSFDHVVWTGPIDDYFEHCHGRLAYRTLDFERVVDDGDVQGCAVMNYCDADVPYTRVTEHKHLAPWEQHERSLLYVETSRACAAGDVPYYPIRLAHEQRQLGQYLELAQAARRVTFAGRLGTYRYLDMDAAIGDALDTSTALLDTLSSSTTAATRRADHAPAAT